MPNSEYRWTQEKALLFLRALAFGYSVAASAALVGMSRQSAYRLRERLGEVFAEAWDEGQRVGALRRAQRYARVPQGDTPGPR